MGGSAGGAVLAASLERPSPCRPRLGPGRGRGAERDARRLGDALAVARAAGYGRYVAWCNTGAGKDSETSVFAAALAATHGGVVLPFERRLRWHVARLRLTRRAPAGMPASRTGRYGVGLLRLRGRALRVAAPVEAAMKLLTHAQSPWFGRPRIDLDGDGLLGPGMDEPAIGSTIAVGGKRYLFTARFNYGGGVARGPYQFDYALAPFGELGITHRVSVSVRWGGEPAAARSWLIGSST